MAFDSPGQDLSINQLNVVRSAVMIDNDTHKQKEKKKKQDEERPSDKLELSSLSLEDAKLAASEPAAPDEQASSPLITGVKIDILAR